MTSGPVLYVFFPAPGRKVKRVEKGSEHIGNDSKVGKQTKEPGVGNHGSHS